MTKIIQCRKCTAHGVEEFSTPISYTRFNDINFGGLLRNCDTSTGREGGYDIGAIRLGGGWGTTRKSSFLSVTFFHIFTTERKWVRGGPLVVGGGREGGKHPSYEKEKEEEEHPSE